MNLPRVTTLKERQLGMLILFVALLCTGMGQTLFFAILPPIARGLGLNEIQISSIFTLSGVLWVVMSPLWGGLSDRWGRKPVIIIGTLGFSVSTGGFGLLLAGAYMDMFDVAFLFVAMIMVRGVFGLFGSGAPSAAQAYIADRTSRAHRSKGMAAIGAAFGMGTVIGPGFAALFALIHILVPFLVLSTLSLLMSIVIFFKLPERRRPIERVSTAYMRLKPTDSRAFPFLTMGVGLSVLQASVMQVAAFFIMDTLDFDAIATTQLVGLSMMSMAVATLIAQIILIPRLSLSVRQMMFIGSIVSLLGVGLLLLPIMTPTLFMFALFLLGFGRGFLGPAIAAGASLAVEPHEQGAIAGYLSSTAAVGVLFLPILVMPLYQLNTIIPFWIALFVVLGILVMTMRLKISGLEEPNKIETVPPKPIDPAR